MFSHLKMKIISAGQLSLCLLACGGCVRTRIVRIEVTRIAPIPAELIVPIPEPAACLNVETNGQLDRCEAGRDAAMQRANADRTALRNTQRTGQE